MPQLTKGYATIADGQVHFRLRPGAGTPAVFLHQTASSGVMWERVMAALPEDRLRILVSAASRWDHKWSRNRPG